MSDYIVIDKKSLVAASLILFLIIVICGFMSVHVLNDPAVKYSQVMLKSAMDIRDNYPDSVDWKSVFVSARRGMTDELDRFSNYVDHEQLMQFEEDLTGGYFGIGISVYPHDSGLLILDVRESSPASQAGLLNGDIIVAADTVSLVGMSALDAVRQLKGEENTILSITVYRPATNDRLNFEIVRSRIDFLHIPYAGLTADSIIYVRLLDFNAGSSGDLKKAVDSLVEKSGVGLKGLILDLRNNPGGLFSEARRIAEMFLEKGSFIVGTLGRSKWREETYYVENEGGYENLPVAVIVNGGSASASEILAGVLKYSNHAVLVGDTTFGKGLVQGFISLPNGDGLRLTISRYFFEGQRFINNYDSLDGKLSDTGTGLVPDIHYDFAEENEFYLELERSLLLTEFAHKHQNELVNAGIGEKQKWLTLFKQYAAGNNFIYGSELTKKAKEFQSEVDTKALNKLAETAVKFANAYDENLYDDYAGQIWQRLRQIAHERKFGTYSAYKNVIVPESEVIGLASAALKEKSQK